MISHPHPAANQISINTQMFLTDLISFLKWKQWAIKENGECRCFFVSVVLSVIVFWETDVAQTSRNCRSPYRWSVFIFVFSFNRFNTAPKSYCSRFFCFFFIARLFYLLFLFFGGGFVCLFVFYVYWNKLKLYIMFRQLFNKLWCSSIVTPTPHTYEDIYPVKLVLSCPAGLWGVWATRCHCICLL